MIYVNKEEVTEDSFVSLLEATKTNVNAEFINNGIPKGINGLVFEEIVYKGMVAASINTVFNGHIEQTGKLSFPDIIARKLYGVEVKMTESNKWVSTGNSVLETTRIQDVETIYMFFGKFGNSYEAKYRKYQDCLYDVGVTHSPRYKIDMNLPDGSSIFHKIGVSYDEFRGREYPIKTLKEYYRAQLNEGEELWWIDPTVEETSVSPIIKPYRLLEQHTKEQYIIECMILFPEIFGSDNNKKFERAAAYLITNYNAVSSSLRDSFTAGGKVQIVLSGSKVYVSRILYNLYIRSKDILRVIQEIPISKLSHYWRVDINDSPIIIWHKLLSEYDDNVVDVFNSSVTNKDA